MINWIQDVKDVKAHTLIQLCNTVHGGLFYTSFNHNYIETDSSLNRLMAVQFICDVHLPSIHISRSVCVFLSCQEEKCTTSGATDRKHRRRVVQNTVVCGCVYAHLSLYVRLLDGMPP